MARIGRKLIHNRKKILWITLLVWVLVVRSLSGCDVQKESREKVQDLTFSVVSDEDAPEELMKTIESKKEKPFKLTYTDDQGLYIIVGYGQQPTGGYSIAVQDLYLTDNAILLDTQLSGPRAGEQPGNQPSYPYIVILTELREEPVIFK